MNDQPNRPELPPATTAIVFGAVAGEPIPALTTARRVLWIVDEVSRSLSGMLPVPPERIEEVRLPPSSVGDEITHRVEAFCRHDARTLPTVLTGSLDSCAAAYRAAIAETHRILEANHAARFTRQQDGFTWQKHLLANARALLTHPLPAHWAGRWRDVPALIVGAGPSLAVSATALAAAAPGAVVFSADSSLRALAKLGITADFAVTIDIAKEPAKCLPRGTPLPHHVALAGVSPPAWQEVIPAERLHFLAGRQITEDWFASLGAARPPVSVVENCGATAIELAIWLGCAPIYLFGLDLAVTEGEPSQRHHPDAEASLYRNSHYDPSARLPRVPGNYADTVPTFAAGDWHALDARLAERTSPEVINVTDRGARFRGTTLVHPSRFLPPPPLETKAGVLARLSAAPTADPVEVLARLDLVRRRGASLLPGLRQTLERSGPVGLAAALGRAVLDPQLGRMLGAYTLKLMPHLVPPIVNDPLFWQRQLDEWDLLTRPPDSLE